MKRLSASILSVALLVILALIFPRDDPKMRSVSLIVDGKAHSPYVNSYNSFDGRVFADGFWHRPDEIPEKLEEIPCPDEYSIEIKSGRKYSTSGPQAYRLYDSAYVVVAEGDEPPSLPYSGTFFLGFDICWSYGVNEYVTNQYYFCLVK